MRRVAAAICAIGILLAPLTTFGEDEPTQAVTLLFTNDFESAYDPVEAYWRDDLQRIGGIAHLATLIDDIRKREDNVFLFDAGDIFTGTLSKLTKGELPFELMITLDYDAMSIGNHEFEYGWEEFGRQKNRAPVPVLGANLFYKGTDHPYAQPYAVVERNGIRIGVIGILGQDAATALIPSNIAGVDVRAPGPIVTEYVQLLRPEVDLVVLLTHQGKTAPMQTDDEARPEIQRDIDADIALAGVTDGIDVLLGGHADAGTREPVIQPRTGTIIMQTYGQGYHLGYLRLDFDPATRRIAGYDGKLIAVDSDALEPHPQVQRKIDAYRARHAALYETIASAEQRITRRYNQESDLGNLFADIVREEADSEIGLMPSGALRKDLPGGEISVINLLDAFPFTDRVAVVELSGSVLAEIIEQGLSLERGILQVSGLEVHYDPTRLAGQRLLSVEVNGAPLENDRIYRVGTVEILAQGGDAYTQFRRGNIVSMSENTFGDVLQTWFRSRQTVELATRGRLTAAGL
jgi:2',3'-cyclic-nucleotide 2'-phosphodiesterase (5'-nucleotidase family)